MIQRTLPLLFLVACIGPISAPKADIDPADGPYAAGVRIVLDGSGSEDGNKTSKLPVSYEWFFIQKPPGSEAALSVTDEAQISFVPDAYGDFEVGLIVNNGHLISDTASVVLTVQSCGLEPPEVSKLSSAPNNPGVGTPVKLSGTVSDPDEACDREGDLTWQWSVADLPAGSTASLNDGTLASPSFVPDVPGTYSFALDAWDADGNRAATRTVEVEVSECGAQAPTIDDITATSGAGVGDLVGLTISASDPDAACAAAGPLTVHSSFTAQPPGSAAVLAPSEGTTPGFLADMPGDYVVRTVVSDLEGHMAIEETTVTVSDCGAHAPVVAQALSNATPNVGELVTVDLSLSDSDIDDCSLTQLLDVTSMLVTQPAGSTATLSPTMGTTPAFTPDVSGTYIVRSIVTDDTGRSSIAESTVVADVCGGQDPSAEVLISHPVVDGPSTGPLNVANTVLISEEVVVSAATSMDPDTEAACGLTGELTYSWKFIGLPAGSTATLNNAAIVSPSFVVDKPGTYDLEVEVTDETGRWDHAIIRFTAAPVALTLDPTKNVEWLDGESTDWSSPTGVTVDNNGDIYVVQSGNQSITVTTAAGTTVLATADLLTGAQDVAYDAGRDVLLVTNDDTTDSIIEVDPILGLQSVWADTGMVDPRGIDVYTDLAGMGWVAVADSLGGVFYDADGIAPVTADGVDDFGGSAAPWGILGLNDGVDDLWALTDVDEFIEQDPVQNTVLASGFTDLRDVTLTGGNYVVADGAGTLWWVEACGNPSCTTSMIATGAWTPTGLHVDAAGNVLVTDVLSNSLYRFSGF